MARRRTYRVGGGLEVDGLRDITRGLGRFNAGGAISAGHKEVIGPVLHKSRRSWAAERGLSQANKVLTGSATRRQAGIVIHYRKYPYAAGVEFGSHAFKQFRPWTGNRYTVTSGKTSGYHVLPTIADEMENIKATYAREMTDAIMKAIKGA